MKKTLMKGNHAAGEAAVRAGCMLYAGYPITPSTEIMEHLSARMPEEGRVFIQAENEIASIHMVGGAYCTGKRAMTATSAGGFSLMQEFTAYASDAELPFVIINVVRSGRGIGSLEPGQDGYRQSVYGGGNGDYRNIVYVPNTIQEMVDDIYEAFDTAEKYRIGVIILTESSMGQMMEPVIMPDYKFMEVKPEWAVTGTHKWDRGSDGLGLKRKAWAEKMERMTAEMQRWEDSGLEDAEYVFVAYGLPSRSTGEAVKALRAKGEKVGFIRPQIVSPFPAKAFEKVNRDVKGFICVETTEFGQMVQDLAIIVKKEFARNVPVNFYPYGIGVPSVKEVLANYEAVKAGGYKEVF